MSTLVTGSSRELGTVGLVGSIAGAYAAFLVMTSSFLGTLAERGGEQSIGVMLGVVSTVFILTALYVAVVVISHSVDTVIAGRLRQIALLRLLGARSRDLRRQVAVATTRVGVLGAVIGTVVGLALAHGLRVVLIARGTLPEGDYAWAAPGLVLALLAIAVATAVAGRLGSAGVLRVSPTEAMTDAAAPDPASARRGVLRGLLAASLVLGGGVTLLGSAYLGEDDANVQIAFLGAFAGSVCTATGLLIGALLIIPSTVSGVGRLLGRDPASGLARRNAVKDPLRTTRSTMGLVIGVTLVTTFAAGLSAIETAVASWDGMDAEQRLVAGRMLDATQAVLVAMVLVSAVIAAVGFVSTMALTVIQRRREIGLLRAMGFTGGQVRAMISREAVALAVTAMGLGLLFGMAFGTLGAQALVGSLTTGLAVGVPWTVVIGTVVCTLVLVLAATLRPARRAVAVPPVEALHVT